MWDPDSGDVVPSVSRGQIQLANSNLPPTQTDLARLRSLLFSGESSLEVNAKVVYQKTMWQQEWNFLTTVFVTVTVTDGVFSHGTTTSVFTFH